MLRKYEGCHGRRDASTGEVPRQARARARAPWRMYARASCKLDKLQAGQAANTRIGELERSCE